MFEEDGRVELEWLAGSGLLMRAKGHPVDMVKALILGLRKVVADSVPAKNQREAMRLLADCLLKLMDATTMESDFAALL